MANQLDDDYERLVRIYGRRHKLGGFDANAEDILVICGALLTIIDHLIKMEKASAKTQKR